MFHVFADGFVPKSNYCFAPHYAIVFNHNTLMVKNVSFLRNLFLGIVGLLLVSVATKGQVSITGTTPVTEDFNSIGTSGTATLPTGFRIGRATAAYSVAATATEQSAGTSGTNVVSAVSTGGTYNWANGVTASSTDRALGFLTSTSTAGPGYLFMELRNNSGATITGFNVSFDCEKYRSGTRAFDLRLQTSTDGATFTTTVSAGGQQYAADANNTTVSDPPATITKSFTLSSLSVANGASFYLRWTYVPNTGTAYSNAQGIGVDNISVQAIIPCAGAPNHATASTTPSSICSGNTTSLSLSGYSSETGISYQWQSSASGLSSSYGNISGATNTSYTSGTLLATTYYRCITTCANSLARDTSAATSVAVSPIVTPLVAVSSSPTGPRCTGATVTYTATPTNGGSTPLYQWKKGGADISGATNTTYTYTPQNNDAIVCVLTTTLVCVTSATATSSTVTMTVNPLPSPTLSGTTTIATGHNATLTFGGATGDVVYYWNGGTTVTSTISGGSTATVTVTPSVTTTYSVTSATSAAGCSNSPSGQFAIITVSSPTTDTIPTREDNMKMGNPSGATTATTDSNNYLIVKNEYTLSYNNRKGMANWVSWHLSRAWKGSAARCNCFTQDGTLPSGYFAATSSDYTSTGFDRGHLCPSDDRDGNSTENANTFKMTNISPQAPVLNQQTWGDLETYCRKLIYQGNELYIVAGGYGTGGGGSLGGSTTALASGSINVPSHFWKVILVLPNGIDDTARPTTTTRMIAVDIPNQQTANTHSWDYYRVPVDTIEARTGFNFFDKIADTAENVIEAVTDSGPAFLAQWDLTGLNNVSTAAATGVNDHMDTAAALGLNVLTRGSGASSSTGANSFRTTGFSNNGISLANTDYFQFKVKADSGYTLSLSGFDVGFDGTGSYYASPGVTSQFAYSLDGTTYTLIGSPYTSISLNPATFDCSGVSALQNVPATTTVYIRYYASGQTTSGGWGFGSSSAGEYGLIVNGSLSNNGCSGAPAAGTTSASAPTIYTGTTSSLTLAGRSTAAGVSYRWQSSTSGGAGTFANISGATSYTYTTTNLSTSTYYRCISTCSISSQSSTSTTTSVTVTPTLAAIAGPSTVCPGSTITMSNAVAGGNWTSSNGRLTIGTSSGIVTGVAAGNAVITYAAGASRVTTTVTVGSPSPIAGPTSVCAGQTITLSSSTTGGTWSRSSIHVGIGSSNGQVTGSIAGLTTVTYSIGASCYTTYGVSVYAFSPITGASATCAGQTLTLANATTGGTWSSSATAVATVGSANHVVTGVRAGIAAISYTMPTGCIAVLSLTVNGLSPITGPLSLGTGSVVTMSDATSGGTWSNPSVHLAIGSLSGIVTGSVPGIANISYTMGTGCRATFVMTVYPAITGPSALCSGATVTLANAGGGGTWSSSNTSALTIGAGTGVVSGIGAGTATISYNFSSGLFALKTITVNPTPVISGVTTIVIGTPGTLSASMAGGTWSGSNFFIAIGSASGIVTGSRPGFATVTYTPAAGCPITYTLQMINDITGVNTVCQGRTTTLYYVAGGGAWSSSNTSVATVSNMGVVAGANAGTASISYNLSGGVAAVKTVTVLPAGNITGPATVCAGQTATLSTSIPGGYWSRTSIHILIGSASGYVSGSIPGLPLINYTLGGCISAYTMTVYPSDAISALPAVCAGQSISCFNSVGGGTWSSSSTQVSIGSSSGVATGVSAGTATITYRTNQGCVVTRSVVVNPIAPISGLHSVCPGQTITLSNPAGGGLWSGTSIHTVVGSGTGIVIGSIPGVTTIVYSLGSCSVTWSTTVNNPPTTGSISSPSYIPIGSSVTLTNSVAGGLWSSSNTGVITIGSTGTATGISAGTAIVSYAVTNSSSCTAYASRSIAASLPGHRDANPTGILPTEKELETVTVLPNPNKGEFTISGQLDADGVQSLAIVLMNINGQVVYTKTAVADHGYLNDHLLLQGIAKGIYLLQISTERSSKVIRVVIE